MPPRMSISKRGALPVGTVVIGAFDDARVAETLTLGPQEQPLYLLPIGRN